MELKKKTNHIALNIQTAKIIILHKLILIQKQHENPTLLPYYCILG